MTDGTGKPVHGSTLHWAEPLVRSLMKRTDLTYDDRAVFMLLSFMSSSALPFAVEATFVAKHTKLSVRGARRALKRLEELGCIASTLVLGVRYITAVRIDDPPLGRTHDNAG